MHERTPLIIAIDGPSGAGKGTVARAVAARLGYRHIDTGAMYRAVAWKALHEGVDLADEAAVAALAERAQHRGRRRRDRGRRTRRGGGDPHARDRRAAAAVARQPRVREVLIAQQRENGGARAASSWKGATSARSCFPDADVKIYPRCLARGARAAPGARSGACRRDGPARRSAKSRRALRRAIAATGHARRSPLARAATPMRSIRLALRSRT